MAALNEAAFCFSAIYLKPFLLRAQKKRFQTSKEKGTRGGFSWKFETVLFFAKENGFKNVCTQIFLKYKKQATLSSPVEYGRLAVSNSPSDERLRENLRYYEGEK